jgi:nitric oxide dioxygenase
MFTGVAMTPASMERIRASFNQVCPQFDCVAARFYDRFFAADPSARHLFKSDLTAQAAHLTAALALIVRNLPLLDALEQPLNELGAAHALIGVRPDHYPVARGALLLALADVLGACWTSQLAADWERLLTIVAAHMVAGCRPAHTPAAAPPTNPPAARH